jgi:dynein heavy chain 1, cytosolic
LENIKKETSEVKIRMEEADKVMSTLDEVMIQYQPLAKHSGLLFSILERLHLLNPFYQFSLNYFLQVFQSILNSYEGTGDYANKVQDLIKKLYLEVYRRTSPALKSSHKAVLSLLFGASYVQEEDIDLEYFSDIVEKSDKLNTSEPDWVDRLALIFKTVGVGEARMREIAERLASGTHEFSLINDIFGESPRSFLDKVLFMRIVRPDHMSDYVEHLCFELFGQHLAYADEPELREIVERQIDASTPMALCSVDGVDPTFKVESIVETLGSECEIVAMGSKEGQLAAERALSLACRNGTWLLLQNLHLSPDWLENLEKRLAGMSLHPKFRLFFTANFNSRVPTTLLRMSRIVSFERPAGLKSSVKDAFKSFNSVRAKAAPMERSRLFFLLAWAHGVISERLNFVPLGWTKSYDFSNADLESASFVIDKWVTGVSNNRSNVPPASLPWVAMRYLISRTVYGGKVDRVQDADQINAIIDSVFSELSYGPDFQLVSKEQKTTLPEDGSYEAFAKWIDDMPDREPSTWLGLPSNSEERLRIAEGMYNLRFGDIFITNKHTKSYLLQDSCFLAR